MHIDGLEDLAPMDLFATENIDFGEEETENEEDGEENFDTEIVGSVIFVMLFT